MPKILLFRSSLFLGLLLSCLCTPSAAQTNPPAPAPVNPPANKCSGLSSAAAFHMCLAVTNHARSGSWKAAHPTVAQPKPPMQGPGIGGQPALTMPQVLPK